MVIKLYAAFRFQNIEDKGFILISSKGEESELGHRSSEDYMAGPS
jgi:hypothetical protein